MRTLFAASLILFCVGMLNAQNQTATIVFYREPRFATGNSKPMLSCDGVDLGRIENGTYFQITAAAGPHRCIAESSKQPAIDVNVAPGQTAYVHVWFEPTLKDHPALTNTTESEYDEQKARLKAVKEWVRNSLLTSELTIAPQSEQRSESAATLAQSDHLSDEEINAAVGAKPASGFAWIEDMSFASSSCTAQNPALFVYTPSGWLNSLSRDARKQFLPFKPAPEDRLRALTIIAHGCAAGTAAGPVCDSITRVALLSDPNGTIVSEAVTSHSVTQSWQNGFGATAAL